MHDFYGHVCKIWELEYMFRYKVVLFQCEWYNTGTNGQRRTIQIDAHCTSIDVTSRWYQNDLFILPSQAKQVFYLQDTKLRDPWKIVQCNQYKGVTHSNKKQLLMLSLSMLKTILLSIVWVMLKLGLFLKVELQETLIKMKSMTYLMLILIWITICRVHDNCLKYYVLVLMFYVCLKVLCLFT